MQIGSWNIFNILNISFSKNGNVSATSSLSDTVMSFLLRLFHFAYLTD